MIHGFDEESSLMCEGLIGDGCGGGWFFIIKDSELIAYNPQTEETKIFLKEIEMAKSISKKGCIVTIVCEKRDIEFDLSALKIVERV